jgi:autophagy-related protein 17
MEDHVREIENSSSILQNHIDTISNTYDLITNTFTQLEEYGHSRLPTHLSRVKQFEERASSHKLHIASLKQEMFNLVQYYTNFSSSYTALLIEVRRRIEANQHTSLLVSEISTKLDNLWDQEVRARQGFMDLHAAFLPADLWQGIYDPPSRYLVHEEQGGRLPALREGKRVSSASMERRRSAMQGSGDSVGRRSVESSGRRSGESSRR